MEVVTLVAALALIWKVVDAVKLALNRDPSVLTQLVAWAAGVAVAFLVANSDIGESWDVGAPEPLGELNNWSLVLLGLVWASGASGLVDFKRAIDRSDSATMPPLLGGGGTP